MKLRYRLWRIRNHFETKRFVKRLNKNLRRAIKEEQYQKMKEEESDNLS